MQIYEIGLCEAVPAPRYGRAILEVTLRCRIVGNWLRSRAPESPVSSSLPSGAFPCLSTILLSR